MALNLFWPGLLNKKFVKLIQEAQDGTLDLKKKKKNCRSVGGMEKENVMC